MKNSKFFTYMKYEFVPNNSALFDLYAPIISNEAINLYLSLIEESKKQKSLNHKISSQLSKFLAIQRLDLNDFLILKRKLEALSLLKTYAKDDLKDNVQYLYFEINQPLAFSEFIDVQKYRHLLIRHIGQDEYEKLQYIYGYKRIPNDVIDVSSTFDNVFNSDKEIEQITNFNFKKLYESITKTTSLPIIFSPAAQSLIESYYNSFEISFNEMQRCVYDALVSIDTNTFEIDVDLLKNNIEKIVNLSKNIQVFTDIKIHRNASMFIKQLKEDDLEQVFSEYRLFNSEQFYSAIIKRPLKLEEKKTIELLRNEYLIPDQIVNMMVDYSLYRTNGELNRKYLIKIANTINCLNISTLSGLYSYFHYQNKIVSENKQDYNDSKIHLIPAKILEEKRKIENFQTKQNSITEIDNQEFYKFWDEVDKKIGE